MQPGLDPGEVHPLSTGRTHPGAHCIDASWSPEAAARNQRLRPLALHRHRSRRSYLAGSHSRNDVRSAHSLRRWFPPDAHRGTPKSTTMPQCNGRPGSARTEATASSASSAETSDPATFVTSRPSDASSPTGTARGAARARPRPHARTDPASGRSRPRARARPFRSQADSDRRLRECRRSVRPAR